jgi:hypothetical protein
VNLILNWKVYQIGYPKIQNNEPAASYTTFFISLFVLMMMEYQLMLSSALYGTYNKYDSGQTIDYKGKTKFDKVKFVLGYNSTGVIKVFSYDIVLRVIKPVLIVLAYTVDLLTRHKYKALDKMVYFIDTCLIQNFVGIDE